MTSAAVARDWSAVGHAPASGLVDARLELHHAAQIIVSVNISYQQPLPDDSHTNLEWVATAGALVTHALRGGRGGPPEKAWPRFGLRVRDLSLLELDETFALRSMFELNGRTIADGVDWVRAALRRAGLDADRLTTAKHYQIPPAPVADGAPFTLGAKAPAFVELANFYADGWLVASDARAANANATEPRCWPHHFDLATLLTASAPNETPARTIGVGLSPGDDSYAEPYFYVGPYPYPPVERLGLLRAGHWHTKDWTGAVLTASELEDVAGTDAGRQRATTLEWSREAVARCREALGLRG